MRIWPITLAGEPLILTNPPTVSIVTHGVRDLRILVTGASGALGAYVVERLVSDGLTAIAWSGSELGQRSGVPLRPIDLGDAGVLSRSLDETDPEAIIHLAAISSAAACLADPVGAARVNVDATARLADWCERRGRRLVFTSTDLVFSGQRAWNREDDPAEPVLVYGRMKRAAEASVTAAPGGLVARMSLMFGPSRRGQPAFFDRAVADLREGRPRSFFADEYRTPLDYATAATILSRLVRSEERGTLHVAGAERMSRYDLMRRIAASLGLDASLVLPGRQNDTPGPEPRPADVSLATDRLRQMFPDLERPGVEEVAGAW